MGTTRAKTTVICSVLSAKLCEYISQRTLNRSSLWHGNEADT